ncbi:MAG: hypothetical protein A3H50_01480 [Candidatus Levybacteria bacterium RIFCSPLOWO2_02_FULL_37_10]|nr:MAG: hypothetical protein A2860_03190 [Candidatus Levybacteria bacterium RIFCSPHIGHO2_01_FULL_37_33]OGH16913.1 MAG: hypothetical protein A3C97_00135 [Candidatus Levybacteria bacterium RIFCSPHIGHO2_02_FULL_37_11]OGH29871.1 MAG: hypothetical protein A3F30_01630 [Candidatus Levybacteria bacterium RIFCSPHIGHO2_12_FULL_37_12]OGH32977.1 MAG: hypothetical protein A2953_00990 [Candidatus Levybacteria bacterium RIFCSPLOWO2_01_FULL_36_54]OGH43340.1 MAG: hypothetical protein A3H50_01480 [Candidatus Lev
MEFLFMIHKPHLKVFSAVCSNFVVVWIIGAFATRELFVLTSNILAAILMWYAAAWAEKELERNYES